MENLDLKNKIKSFSEQETKFEKNEQKTKLNKKQI